MRILLDGEYFAAGDSLEVVAEIAEVDVARLSYELDDLREAKREEIAQDGENSLKGFGARNLSEAQIAATGKIDELVRGELSEGDRAKIEAELDGLQAVRDRWNAILAKIDEAATHADLDAISWEMEL